MADLKIKAKAKDGVITVKALFNHPMETGLRKDKKTGDKIPAHFINEVTGSLDGKEVIKAYWNGAISKNPYFSFKCKGDKGGKVKIAWKDNKDGSGEGEAAVK